MDLQTTLFVWAALIVAGILLVIAWILVPVILLRTNARLGRICKEQQRTNEILQSLRRPRDGAGVSEPKR